MVLLFSTMRKVALFGLNKPFLMKINNSTMQKNRALLNFRPTFPFNSQIATKSAFKKLVTCAI